MDRAARLRQPRAARAWLGWAALIAAASVLALWWAPARRADAQLSAADAAEAQTLFQTNCATCHGGAGQGGATPAGRPAPAIAGPEGVGAAYWDLVMSVGRMPPPADPFDNRARERLLDDDEIELIVDWAIAELGVEDDRPEVGEGAPGRGLEVYGLNCAHCHGSTAAGGVAGGGAWTPALLGLDDQTIVEAIRVGPFEMPAFSTDQISDQQAADVAAFIHEIGEETTTPLGLLELNPVFASGFVILVSAAMIVALMLIAGRPAWLTGEKLGRPGEPSTPLPASGGMFHRRPRTADVYGLDEKGNPLPPAEGDADDEGEEAP